MLNPKYVFTNFTAMVRELF